MKSTETTFSADSGDILVVDDTPASLQLLADILTSSGHQVRTANTGELAIGSARAKPPALILLDIMLPGMNGLEVCRQLKADPKTSNVPIIFISVLEDGHAKADGFKAGAVDYISKPFFVAEVLARVRTHLAISQLQHSLERQNKQLLEEIDERKRGEQERQKLITELEKRNDELDRFASTVSHDLKSPLVTIIGFIDQLEQDLENDARDNVKTDLAYIESAAQRMSALLDNLLQLSRAGRAINEPQPVDLPALALQVTAQLASQLAHIHLLVTMPDDLPVVRGDALRLAEVFQNLIENAAKFTVGQPEPQLEVGGAAVDNEVHCWVRDNGIGIPKEHQEKVFGLFVRLDRSIEGTGIGLAIVRRIVEGHGGRVWVESAGAGYGCTFFFTLPTN